MFSLYYLHQNIFTIGLAPLASAWPPLNKRSGYGPVLKIFYWWYFFRESRSRGCMMQFAVSLWWQITHSSCFAAIPFAPMTPPWPGTSSPWPRGKPRRGETNCWATSKLLCGLSFDRASSRSPRSSNTLLTSSRPIRRKLRCYRTSS